MTFYFKKYLLEKNQKKKLIYKKEKMSSHVRTHFLLDKKF